MRSGAEPAERGQVGPLDNSYPTDILNSSGIYANTYGGNQ